MRKAEVNFSEESEALIRDYYVASRQVRCEAGATVGANLPVTAVKTMYVLCSSLVILFV